MNPLFNSFPHHSNQIQTNTSNPSPQGFPSNQSLANSSNMFQNSMQMQPQMGLINPQMPVFDGGQNMAMPKMAPQVSLPGFVNGANNYMGMPQLSMVGPLPRPSQCVGGFGPQNGGQNLNSAMNFMVQGQFSCLGQNMNQPQGNAQNMPNLPQQLNYNMGLPNGQLYFQNSMQNANQLLSMQMSHQSGVAPFGYAMPSLNTFGFQNQAGQGIGPNTFLMNSQFGPAQSNQVGQQVNQNHQNLISSTMGVGTLTPSPIGTQQAQGNSSASLNSCSVQQQSLKNMQPSDFTRSQGNPVNNGWSNTPNPHWKNSPRKNFTKNPKKEMSQWDSQKSQFHHMKNGKRKFVNNDHKGKGMNDKRAGKFGFTNSTSQNTEKKRSLSLTYTEQEIHQWREERRKNYPSKDNTEKKLIDSKIIDREAKLRREQLKDILAKQAELGVEVAEIPSCYLSDSEKQVNRKEDNRRQSAKKGRFRNKFDKRGRYNKKGNFAKNENLADKDSSNNPPSNKKKPTLLEKLLSEDVRRDKSRMLQVLRFMVTNSFFEDWPQKPLKFPTIITKDSVGVGEVVGKEVFVPGTDDFQGNDIDDNNVDGGDASGNHIEEDENSEDDSEVGNCIDGKGCVGPVMDEEEGEIID